MVFKQKRELKTVNGTRDPTPPHRKCQSKFPYLFGLLNAVYIQCSFGFMCQNSGTLVFSFHDSEQYS